MANPFVGRDQERALFASALSQASLTRPVLLLVHGMGGTGKSALLASFLDLATSEGVASTLVELSEIEQNRQGLRDAAGHAREVLFLDAWERAEPVATWLRRHWREDLPDVRLVVAAGREAPTPDLVVAVGWQADVHVVQLGGLGRADTAGYLEAAAVPAELRETISRSSTGNPLAVCTLAHRAAEDPTVGLVGPDPVTVRVLLEGIVEPLPSRRHRQALQVCAHALYTTEDLLGAVIDGEVRDLFEWLRRQPYVTEARWGLQPDDLVRTLVEADLRWRDRSAYSSMHAALMRHVLDRVQLASTDIDSSVRDARDAIFLSRYRLPGPLGAADSRDWALLETTSSATYTLADESDVLAVAAQSHSSTAMQDLHLRLRTNPEAVVIFRCVTGEVIGFGSKAVHSDWDATNALDPATALIRAHTDEHGPPRPGEHITVFRIEGMRPGLRAHSAVHAVTLAALNALADPQNSWDFLVLTAPTLWRDTMEFFDFHLVGEVTIDGQSHGVFGHDWRRLAVHQWLARIVDRPWDAPPAPITGVRSRVVTDEREFVASVRDALRDLHADRRLVVNPLIDSRLVRSGDPCLQPVGRLRSLVSAAAEELREDGPEGPALFRIIDRTYLRQNIPQQRVADSLGLPFSTYRRHRNRAVERIAAGLWRRECGLEQEAPRPL